VCFVLSSLPRMELTVSDLMHDIAAMMFLVVVVVMVSTWMIG